MIVYRKTYNTLLSIDDVYKELQKITSAPSILRDDGVFFIGSFSKDSFNIQPIMPSRLVVQPPTLLGTYYQNGVKTIINIQLKYQYNFMHTVLLFFFAMLLSEVIKYDKILPSNIVIDVAIHFVLITGIYYLLISIVALRLLANVKLFLSLSNEIK